MTIPHRHQTPRRRPTLPRPRNLILAVAIGLAPVATLSAQLGGANSGGAIRMLQEQRMAGNWRRVLMLGAHPDDEDTELLAILSRGMGTRVAYLSLTRGDGGQNLIGEELGEALGVLRTEELASARAIDGAEQFFTRAYDFGFSKTAEETFRFWNRDSILKDVVRVIRRFRPQVLVAVFSGTPADGHGHHQASGLLAPEAFRAAGDPNRFPELAQEEGLSPWQPSKLYRVARGRSGAGVLAFDGGVIDPATGMSLHQIAARSRSQHRSQNQGALEQLGPSRTGVQLELRSSGVSGADDSLFAGIAAEPPPTDDEHAAEAWLSQHGVVLDATTDDDEVTPGQHLSVNVAAWNAGSELVRTAVHVVPADGFAFEVGDCGNEQNLATGTLFSCTARAAVMPHANATQPYYLARPREGAMYRWGGPPTLWGLPSAPPLRVQFSVSVPGHTYRVYREVQARFRDPVLGEVRRPVMIVPRVALSVTPAQLLWPASQRQQTVHLMIEHSARDTIDGQASVTVPAGWTVTAPQPVHFTRKGEHADVAFVVRAPAVLNPRASELSIDARLVAGPDTFATGVVRVRYPHVRPRNLLTRASARIVVADVRFPVTGTIGYVRGGGDRMPETLQSVNLPVTVLSDSQLERGDLARFHVMVIGPRAYEASDALVRAHPRLMAWLDAGGTLIIQYQQQPWVRGNFPPRPLTLGSPTQNRVTDETAPVTMLLPEHPLLTTPNRIGPADFEGWVQERGLDFPPSWDAAWTPLLEMHDPGDPPLRGGLLVARVGRGTVVYTGLSFHRELPALVPGAWRLFANLLGAGLPRGAAH